MLNFPPSQGSQDQNGNVTPNHTSRSLSAVHSAPDLTPPHLSSNSNGFHGSSSTRSLYPSGSGSQAGASAVVRKNTPAGQGGVKSSYQFTSVTSQFKRQLAELMSTLGQMAPHYVRCIKPNPASVPAVFDNAYCLNQLKCSGVMEAVRISCAGTMVLL